MKFNRVLINIEVDIMTTSNMLCYEHEVPVYQAVHGSEKITLVDDKLKRTGPVNGDFNLNDEWSRLMEKPRMIQISEGNSQPAPLVAFPRGVLDLEDFYARIRRPQDTAPKAAAKPKGMPNLKDQRAAVRARLDALSIDYRGNASTDSLLELLSSVEDENVSTDLQNEG